MSWALRKSGQAIDDLAGIWDYIAIDNPAAAEKLVRELLTLFDKTAGHPQLGRAADEIGEGVRILTRGAIGNCAPCSLKRAEYSSRPRWSLASPLAKS